MPKRSIFQSVKTWHESDGVSAEPLAAVGSVLISRHVEARASSAANNCLATVAIALACLVTCAATAARPAFAADKKKVAIPFDFVSKFDDGRYGKTIGDMLWKKLSRQALFVIRPDHARCPGYRRRQKNPPHARHPPGRGQADRAKRIRRRYCHLGQRRTCARQRLGRLRPENPLRRFSPPSRNRP